MEQCPNVMRGIPVKVEINGKEEMRCRGWRSAKTDEYLDICRNCKEWFKKEKKK